MANKPKLKELLFNMSPKEGQTDLTYREIVSGISALHQAIKMLMEQFAELQKVVSGKELDLGDVPKTLADLKAEFKSAQTSPHALRTVDLLTEMAGNSQKLLELSQTPAKDNSAVLLSGLKDLKESFTTAQSEIAKSIQTLPVNTSGTGKFAGSGLVNVSYDYAALSNYSGSNPQTIVLRAGGSSGNIVANLTLTYDGSGNLLTVTKQIRA